MDNIKFLGYSADGTFKKALRNRKNHMNLETLYKAVNEDTISGCCSCCKQDNIVYAVQPVGIPQIKTTALSICDECASRLPVELTIINLDSNGAPPALIYKIYESEV